MTTTSSTVMDRHQIAADIAASAASAGSATRASIGSGLGLFGIGAMSVNELAMVVGAAVAVGTFVVNWYYQRQKFLLELQKALREQREFDARMSHFPEDAHK